MILFGKNNAALAALSRGMGSGAHTRVIVFFFRSDLFTVT